MLYDATNPDSLFWSFLLYGRGGRVLSVQQASKLGRRATIGDGYGAGAGD